MYADDVYIYDVCMCDVEGEGRINQLLHGSRAVHIGRFIAIQFSLVTI